MNKTLLRAITMNNHIFEAFKQQVRCNQKGLQRLREFVLSETHLCSAESNNLCSQMINA